MVELDGREFDPDCDLELLVRFVPPDRRRRDQGNFYAMLKPHIDGIFDSLKSDDSRIKRTVIDWLDPSTPPATFSIQLRPRTLGFDVNWTSERGRVRSLLRELCEYIGDNDWGDKLDLGDVIDKHVLKHLRPKAIEND